MSTTVITTGRFSPPTMGHSLVFKNLLKAKKHFGAERALLYTTHSQDPKKNPLEYNDKVGFLKALVSEKYPGIEVVSSEARNIIESLIELNGTTDNIIVVVGGDRIAEFEVLLNKYNGREYQYDDIKIISAGERDPDSDSTSGLSATKMRQYAAEGNFQSFRRGIDSFNDELIQDIYHATRKGMKIEESTRGIRDAYTSIQLREFCRFMEEGETPGSDFLSRVSALYGQAGVDFESTGEEEEVEIKVEYNKEGADMDQKYPYIDSSEYTGNVAVLFVDPLLGTKYITQYIGRTHSIINEALQGDLARLRVVVRQLRDLDINEQKEKLINLKIAWDSDIGNPSYSDAKSNMQIDFAVETTEVLLKAINGDKIYLHGIGSLNQEGLMQYVAEFKKLWEEQGNEAKNFDDGQGLKNLLVKNEMTPLSKQVISNERKALEIINGFVAKLKEGTNPPTQEDIDKFSQKFGVDKRIIGNYLTIQAVEEENKKRKSGERVNPDFEQTFRDWEEVYGLGGLFQLADIAIDERNKNMAKEEA